MVNGDDARIVARSLKMEARVSGFYKRVSIRASTTINDWYVTFKYYGPLNHHPYVQ